MELLAEPIAMATSPTSRGGGLMKKPCGSRTQALHYGRLWHLALNVGVPFGWVFPIDAKGHTRKPELEKLICSIKAGSGFPHCMAQTG